MGKINYSTVTLSLNSIDEIKFSYPAVLFLCTVAMKCFVFRKVFVFLGPTLYRSYKRSASSIEIIYNLLYYQVSCTLQDK